MNWLRLFAVAVTALLMFAPGAAAEETDDEVAPLDHPDDDHGSPGVGLLASMALVGVVFVTLRRRS